LKRSNFCGKPDFPEKGCFRGKTRKCSRIRAHICVLCVFELLGRFLFTISGSQGKIFRKSSQNLLKKVFYSLKDFPETMASYIGIQTKYKKELNKERESHPENNHRFGYK